jgi:MYXO-CTERM domain-containing protein
MHTRIPLHRFALTAASLALTWLSAPAASAASFPADIDDGTSNTILFGETQPNPNGAGIGGASGSIGDGTSNTIIIGGGSSPGHPGTSGGTGTITDGTSNTINLGDTTSSHSVPDGGPTAMFLLGAFAATALLRRRAR